MNPVFYSFQRWPSTSKRANRREGEGLLAIIDHLLGDSNGELSIDPNRRLQGQGLRRSQGREEADIALRVRVGSRARWKQGRDLKVI